MTDSDIAVITGPPADHQEDPTVVTLGVFDGVHRGHRYLIARARAAADRADLPLTVVTFDPHPLSVVRPELAPLRLATPRHRIRLLAGAGVDKVRLLTFDRQLSALEAPDFAARYLVRELQAAVVVAGENFRFGHRAAGDLDLLAAIGTTAGFDVVSVPLDADESETWSSTRIRALVTAGDVAGAALGLAREHRVEGPVVVGDKRGRTLGYPTANLEVEPGTCVPLDGVYAGFAVVDPYTPDERRVPAAVSVGANTTFGGTEPRVEAHLMEPGEWDLYGRELAVDFVARLRGMHTFSSQAELVSAMAADVAAARRLLA